LEGEVALLSKSQPLFFLELLEFLLKVIEEAPGCLSIVQLILHKVIVLKLRRSFSEMLSVDIELLDFCLELIPRLFHVFHNFRSLHGLFVRELISLLGLFLLPAIVHFLKLNT
jgi:hypothetical protein